VLRVELILDQGKPPGLSASLILLSKRVLCTFQRSSVAYYSCLPSTPQKLYLLGGSLQNNLGTDYQ